MAMAELTSLDRKTDPDIRRDFENIAMKEAAN